MMRTMRAIHGLAIGVAAAAAMAPAPGRAQQQRMTDEQIIASVMRAAPPAVSERATVIAIETDGKARTLRQGTNGFTCLPDNPATPGSDMMCLDRNGMEWAQAWIGRQAPPADKLGFGYMLAGEDTTASNTDPFATAPPAGGDWIRTGPHIMIFGPATARMMAGYPREARPDTTQPYVMWLDTPYEHLMIPLR